MKHLLILLFVASALFAQCPLGFSPEESCSSDNPSCGLFSDGDADTLCDNPGPQSQPEPEPEPEPTSDPFCPLTLTPEEACSQSTARCTLYSDSNGDNLCDNPGPQPVVPVEEIIEEVEDNPETSDQQDSTPEENTEEIVEIEEVDDPVEVEEDTAEEEIEEVAAVEEIESDSHVQRNTCPLGYSPAEACSEENPACSFFVDSDGNTFCDNPGPGRQDGASCQATDSSSSRQTPSVIGCPLGLPPEAACPDSLALCPHWYGVTSGTSCSNPAGGNRRISIILITLGLLLPVSTWLSRKFYGRRLKDRLKRNSAHHIVRGVSLMILGFGVQGCFCPLGAFQYAFTAQGLSFLGISGIVIFLMPLVFSAFFGRVFCGWVCPMGAVQEFLYSIHVPGSMSPSGKWHRKLRHLSTVILFALIALILLNRFELISLRWSTPFCAVDPFHTIFTLFLSGSLVIAGLTILLAIYVRRFFCRYLCFYGAAQAILARLALWNKIKGIRSQEPEMDSDEEFDK